MAPDLNMPAPSASQEAAASPRLAPLDGLRGIAIALVLWHHLGDQLLPLGRASWLGWIRAGTSLGWIGVELFFALSGFLIGGILIDRRDSPNLMRVFYARRALRILPLYYAALGAIGLLLLARLPHSYHIGPAWVPALFLSNLAFGIAGRWDWAPLSVLWSLAVEEQFYLASPWLIRGISPGRVGWLGVGLVAISELLRVGVQAFSPGTHLFLHVVTLFHMDGLALGILAAWLVRAPGTDALFAALGRCWHLLALAGLGLILVLEVVRADEGSPAMDFWGYPAVAGFFALLILVAVRIRPPGPNRILSGRLLVYLGRRSYFIYLFHEIFWSLAVAHLGPGFPMRSATGVGLVLATVAVTLGAAELSWRWFEGPLIARGHQLKYAPCPA
jgi:peptidoglycan/LPS O-acetylase OafA/YrhL